jgi:predicted Zn-dependent protease
MLYPHDRPPWWLRALEVPRRFFAWIGWILSSVFTSIESGLSFLARRALGVIEGLESAEVAFVRLGQLLLWPFAAFARVLGRLFARPASIIARPIEVAASSASRQLRNSVEIVQVVDLERRVGSLLLWPVRLVQSIFSAISRRLPAPLRAILLAPFSAIAWLGQALIAAFLFLVEALSLDTALFAVARWTRPIWYPIAAAIGFVRIWFVTRSSKQLAWGLPLLLVVSLGAWVAATNIFSGGETVARQYRRAVEQARESKDYTRMHLFERKLAQLGVQTQATDYRTALSFAEQGKFDEAYQRMRALAPEDHPGYPNAHFWIIQNILSGRLKLSPEEGHRLAGAHLTQLDALRVKATALDLMRAFWLAQENKTAEASKILKPLVLQSPTAAIHRLRLDLATNDAGEAHSDAFAVSEHMHRQKRAGVPLTTEDYRSWAAAEDILGNKIVARTIVNDWLAAQPGDKAARATLAAWSINELGQTLNDPSLDRRDLARRIEEAFAIENVPSELKLQVVAFYHQRADDAALRDLFSMLIENAAIPAALADALGSAAATESNWPLARRLLERSLDADSQNAVAWHNLAFVLLKQKKDFDKALIAVNKAIEKQSANLHFRETRGHILVELRQYQEAIPDLELALNGLPDSGDIHQSLAKAYEAIGNSQLAEVHRAAAN